MNPPRLLALLLTVALLAGCTALTRLAGATPVTAASCGRPHPMILVIGAHRDAPRPQLPPGVACQLAAAIQGGKLVRIVVASGQPRLITPALASVTGGTLAQQNSPRAQQNLRRVQAVITAARPDAPGIDDLAALALAADEAHTHHTDHGDLVLIDTGLDDRGALNFTVPGLLAADPAEITSQLRATGTLPSLHGFTVTVAGLGYTAPPQAPLPAKWRTSLTQIWAAVITAAGAHVQIIPQPSQGPAIPTRQPVHPIPVPATPQVTPTPGAPIVFTSQSPVRFKPDSTAFTDPAAAITALTPIARWLAASPDRHATLEGTTADVGPLTGQIRLSLLRADRVRAELIALGAAPAQITTTGAGSHFPQFIPDRSPAGILLAGPATLNRSVRITPTLSR